MSQTMQALRFHRPGGPEVLELETLERPQPAPGEALVEVHAAAINPSDVKNVQGGMPQTHPPRIPGRDFAGVVVEGPEGWRGKSVFGTSGRLGFVKEGTHAQYVVVPGKGLVHRPEKLSMAQAASVGVAYVTAWQALFERAQVRPGETVLVVGGAGAVGSAATQLLRWAGARVLVSVKDGSQVDERFRARVDGLVDSSREPMPDGIKRLTGGTGVEVVLNLVGGETFAPSVHALARGGRLVAISAAPHPEVRLDLKDFYRRELTFQGVNTLQLSDGECAQRLERMSAGFASGALSVEVARELPLSEGRAGYQAVSQGGLRGKVVLRPR